jgi:hypothetical protein
VSAPLVVVTDHAVERYRQRVRGGLDPRPEIAGRVSRAWAAGEVSDEPPAGAAAQRGSVYVRDGDLVFVCLWDRPRRELLVVTVWEEGEDPAVPRQFTDALKGGGARVSGRRTGGRGMGFLDKAKKMAEQAQQKLDDAQKQFSQGQKGQQAGGGPVVEYDEHGRPIQPSPVAPDAPVAGEPSAPPPPPTGGPAAPPPPATPPAPAPPASTPGVPPTAATGDPLAGAAPTPSAPPAAPDAPMPDPAAPGMPGTVPESPPRADAPVPDPAAPAPDAAPSAPPSPPGPTPPEERNRPSTEPPKLSSGDPLGG